MKKYFMTTESKILACGTEVYRIEALMDIPYFRVTKGQKGGFIEYEGILINSETDGCWVADEAIVMGMGTRLAGTVLVKGNAKVADGSVLDGAICVSGDAELEMVTLKGLNVNASDKAKLYDVVLEGNNINVSGNANLYRVRTKDKLENSRITGNAFIEGSDKLVLNGYEIVIEKNARITDGGLISGRNIYITGNAELHAGFTLEGRNIILQDQTYICGDVRLGNNCHLSECVSIYENTESFDPVLENLILGGDLQLHVGEIYEMKQRAKES